MTNQPAAPKKPAAKKAPAKKAAVAPPRVDEVATPVEVVNTATPRASRIPPTSRRAR